jgi:hypothetical protein
VGYNVRETEIHASLLLEPQPSSFEVEIVIEKLERYKSPGIDQIPAGLSHVISGFIAAIPLINPGLILSSFLLFP